MLSLCAMQRNDRRLPSNLPNKQSSLIAEKAIYHYRLAVIHSRFGDHKAAEPAFQRHVELRSRSSLRHMRFTHGFT